MVVAITVIQLKIRFHYFALVHHYLRIASQTKEQEILNLKSSGLNRTIGIGV